MLWAFIVAPFLLVLVIWAFIFRGGITLSMTGLTLVRHDGQRASRSLCAFRAFLVWAPVWFLLFLTLVLHAVIFESEIAVLAWGSAWLYLVACIALALWFPNRSLHDRLAGTYLVPK
jgi:hypothetical protein